MNLALFYSESAARFEPRRLAAIAVLVSDIANPFFAKIIPAIEERRRRLGHFGRQHFGGSR